MKQNMKQNVKCRSYMFALFGLIIGLFWPLPTLAAEKFDFQSQKINGATYCVENGIVVTGWHRRDDAWYYFDHETGAMQTGFFRDETGTLYHSSDSGALTGSGWNRIDDSWHYMEADGAVATGFFEQDGGRYYFDLSTGAMQTGWFEAEGKWYYADQQTGILQTGWFEDKNGIYYFFYENGSMAADTWVGPYWVNPDGSWDPELVGDPHSLELIHAGLSWQGQGWGCKNEDGSLAASDWRTLGGNRYYFGDDGCAVKGWQYIGGYKYYFNEETYALMQNLDGILPAQRSYQITVDRVRCQTIVYAQDGDRGYIIPCRTFICSPGKSSSPTPAGRFTTTNKYRWHLLQGPSYGQYCTRLGSMHILFHSVPGDTATNYNISAHKYNLLGEPASEGCIRLTVADAKWIYDNCGYGTVVTIGDNLPAPFDKPEGIKIPEEQNWDPTDPEIP